MTMRWLALGDSYTCGEGVSPHEAWPAYLAARLQNQGIDIAPPEIVAQTGWTTGELLDALDQSPPQELFDLVTLAIGVNNQYRGGSLSSSGADLGELLERAVAYAGGRRRQVLLLSIPDWSVTPFARERNRAAIAASLDAFNRLQAGIARKRGIAWVDITDISRRMASPEWVCADGLHPAPALHQAWADRLAVLVPRRLSLSPHPV